MKKVIYMENTVKIKEVEIPDITQMLEELDEQRIISNIHNHDIFEIIKEIGNNPFEMIMDYIYEMYKDFSDENVYDKYRNDVFFSGYGIRIGRNDSNTISVTSFVSNKIYCFIQRDELIINDLPNLEELNCLLSNWTSIKNTINQHITKYFNNHKYDIRITQEKYDSVLKNIMEFEL